MHKYREGSECCIRWCHSHNYSVRSAATGPRHHIPAMPTPDHEALVRYSMPWRTTPANPHSRVHLLVRLQQSSNREAFYHSRQHSDAFEELLSRPTSSGLDRSTLVCVEMYRHQRPC